MMNRITPVIAIASLTACLAHADDRPVVTYPINDQKVTTIQLEARGRMPKGKFPFFAVEPMNVSPQTFIQPRIHSADDDGSVSGTIYLGDEANGAEQKFKIYLLACKSENPFGKTKVIQRIPKGCIASAPIEVWRAR
jgi:hypothetical protein